MKASQMLLQPQENPARQFLRGHNAVQKKKEKKENYSLSITVYPKTAKQTPKMWGFYVVVFLVFFLRWTQLITEERRGIKMNAPIGVLQ